MMVNISALASPFTTFSRFHSSRLPISLICSPLATSILEFEPHSQLEHTILNPHLISTKPPSKPKKKVGTTSTQIVDHTNEYPHSQDTMLIKEENPPSTSTASSQSGNPSPHTTSASTTIYDILPSRTMIVTITKMEVDFIF